jgi:hypothetical protein
LKVVTLPLNLASSRIHFRFTEGFEDESCSSESVKLESSHRWVPSMPAQNILGAACLKGKSTIEL